MDFPITTREIPKHHRNRKKMYFPFDKLSVSQGFDVPINLKSRVNYQLNGKKKGLNKVEGATKEFRMFKTDKEDYFQVIRVK